MPEVRFALGLCNLHGRFLFETRPDLFPQGFLTMNEMHLWGRYFEDQNRKGRK